MAGTGIRGLISVLLLSGLTAGYALAESAPICDFRQRIATGHGSGAYALFSGSPGTGKTMTAEILAEELDMGLYRVDLSQVVSKYIGETEKNLTKLFDHAESEKLILYFDEADSLFGKRGGVKDANDRYGNLEADYLFQQIENHRVPVILATERRIVPEPAKGKAPTVVWFGSKGPPPKLQLGFCR